MKKKVLLYLLVFVGLFTITGCGNNKELNNKSSNTNGFKSDYIQGKDEDIEKYPDVKSKALDLESKFIEKKIKINKIEFDESSNQLIITYYFNKGNDKLFNYYLLNKENNEFEFNSINTRIYDNNIFSDIKDIVINSMDFTEEELVEIKKVTKDGDYVRIRNYKYLIDYEEEKDSIGLAKKFRIMS